MKMKPTRWTVLASLAIALPLLSACYSTTGYDGRTYLRPMPGSGIGTGTYYGAPMVGSSALGAPVFGTHLYGPAHPGLIPINGYRAVPRYTYFTPTPMGTAYQTIPATLGYTSFPLVSRRLVSIDGLCIVEPKPVNDCD